MTFPTEPWFTSIPNRDAHAAIRGFSYQAILSVKAWVELGSSELLQLECGEDIDWVSLLSSNRAEDVNRTVGQIKYRVKRLTLRSPEAVMSVFRYWQHLKGNPNLRLQFRFISNADYGTERGNKHPSGLSGIELWHSLLLPLTEGQLHDRAAHIRSVLLATIKPADVDIALWNQFRESLQAFSDSELLHFLRSFSWMLRGTDVEEALARTKIVIAARAELRG